jgi:ketosteroid isomerase-like protein
MNIRTLLFSLLSLAVTGSTAMAAPKDELIAADKAFSDLSAAKGSNTAFLAYMADDARIFGTGNEPPIHGKAEATERFKASGNGDPKTNILRWEPDYASACADGTQGFTDGRWTFDGGGKIHLAGHYLTVWTKDGSGAWKFVADMGTTDPQPERKQ